MKYFQRKQLLLILILATFSLFACKPSDSGNGGSDSGTTTDGGAGSGGGVIEEHVGTSGYIFKTISEYQFPDDPNTHIYEPRGIGGGGAMSGFSISPYSSLWFVGTDMGTLFRSINRGQTWIPINHNQTTYSSDLTSAVGVGFSADPEVVFHAPAGRNPVRSDDAGEHWSRISSFALASGEKIKYWRANSYDANYMYAGTTSGLWQSRDNGLTWAKLSGISGEARGTYIDYHKDGHIIYHATPTGIWKSTNQGSSFSRVYQPSGGLQIRAFTAGRDDSKITFAYIDNDGANACSSVSSFTNDWGATSMNAHYAHCGYVWVGNENLSFTRTNKEGGDHIKMAENNSKFIVVTGSTAWIRQYGTKVWKSTDSGASWGLKLNQYNWDVVPYAAWGQDKLEYSAAALDVGWDDSGYESFDMHLRSPATIGGTGYYFLHTSKNGGDFWNAPFTKYADTGSRAKGKKWKSTGLEVTSVYRFKFHPTNPLVGYAAMADMGGMVTEDGGKSFRISKVAYNSNYDYAFDSNNDQVVYAASGSQHDYPMEWHANAASGDEGGIYKSSNRGQTWTRLTPNNSTYNRQFLTVAYDDNSNALYGGLHGTGIARSLDGGSTWSLFNTGLPAGTKIIPQIEIDPDNGGVYALLTGDAPTFSNSSSTGIYYLAPGGSSWTLLRTTVTRPSGVDANTRLWYYPTSFAVDFSPGSDRSTLWLVDYENNSNWLATGIWKSTNRGGTWTRQSQFTHPLSITLDQENPSNVYVNGLHTIDGSWGNGGLYYTTNGGAVWKKNTIPAFQSNARSATIDPNDRTQLFYTFFGSAMLYGPRPQ
nr:exo-alpha-sialidase [Bacteriovorax sp. HI3]